MTAKIKLNAASGGGSVSIVAPTSTTSNANIELKLPVADGNSDQVIKTDGSGNLSFGQAVTARNLIDNGNFVVAQRGVSSNSTSYRTVDRWQATINGYDETFTQAQVDVASGTTPYTLGFRKAYSITNGNQTSGAQSDSFVFVYQKIEAQNIANSGWNYTDANSFITLSFWIKSSVSQSFNGYIKAEDATYIYNFNTGTLTANTWTKVTKTIPGNSNLVFNNDVGNGMLVNINPYLGTDYTDSGTSVNTWIPYVSASRAPVSTTTWWTTNDATFEITGVQLEVGSTASTFVSESYGETLAKCQRYLYKLEVGSGGGNTNNNFIIMARYGTGSTSTPFGAIPFPVQMRTEPTFYYVGTSQTSAGYAGNPVAYSQSKDMATIKATNTIAANGILYLRVGSGSSDTLDLFFSAEP